jgi:hypothetical protein
MKRKLMLFFFSGFALTGCAHSMGHFSVMSDKNVNGLEPGSSSVKGESCGDYVLFIPVSSRADLDSAFAEAIRKNPEANALKDVTVKRDGLFTFFYNQQCYSVEGTPIKLGK